MIDKLHPRTRQPVEGLVLLLAIVALMWLVEGLNSLTAHGNALDAGSPATNEVKIDDNWLMMAIKIARRKEAESCER